MSDELPARLVHEAAEVMWSLSAEQPMPDPMGYPEQWASFAQAAVASVLETLAEDDPLISDARLVTHLRSLAAQVKE